MLAGLMCFNDGSVATGRSYHTRQIGGEKPDKEATYWSSRIGGGWV